MIRKICFSIWLISATLLCFGESISFSPNPVTLSSPQSFTVSVQLDGPTAIRGFALSMNHDVNMLSFASATQGSIFSGQPIGWWVVHTNVPGLTRVECLIFGAGLFVTGPGTLLNLTYTALAGDYTHIDFSQVTLYAADGSIIPNIVSTNCSIIIGTNPAYAKVKCFLEGPYISEIMSTNINSILPLTSPYGADPVTVSAIPSDVVDWVWVELRQTYNGPEFITKSMFLHSDGSVTTPDRPFMLFMGTPPGSYYIIIKHRNHLAIMSNIAMPFATSGAIPFFDFSLPGNVYGTGSLVDLGSGNYGMAAGDADQNGIIGQSDRNVHWRLQAGQSGYKSSDFDLDGFVYPNDLNKYWRIHLNMSSNVPQP